MYDPKKYDKTDSQENKSESFAEKRTKLIKYISDFRSLMVKECEMLDEYIEKNPDSKAKEPFEEKLDGWSRIINGLDIVKRMYEVV